MKKIRKIIIALSIILSGCAYAAPALMATEQFVTNAVNVAKTNVEHKINNGMSYVSNEIVNAELMIISLSNKVNYIITNYVEVGRYPMFIINMEQNPYDYDYIPFEKGFYNIVLKSSTNNFKGNLFMCGTKTNNKEAETGGPGYEYTKQYDQCRLFVQYSTNGTPSALQAVSSTASIEFSGITPIRELVVIVDPSMTINNSDWLREDNCDIMWSYLRTDNYNCETTSNTNIWRSTMPVKWLRSIPSWANQTPISF